MQTEIYIILKRDNIHVPAIIKETFSLL